MNTAEAPLGLLSFLSFAFSIIAAVLAIDSYRLLRTGGFGKTWRMLIIASVMFALLQVLRLAEILNLQAVSEAHLAQIVELSFVMILAYAFYCQRHVFTRARNRSQAQRDESPDEDRWETEFSEDAADLSSENELHEIPEAEHTPR